MPDRIENLDPHAVRPQWLAVRANHRMSLASSGLAASNAFRRGFTVPALFAFVLGILLVLNTLTEMGEDTYWIGLMSLLVTLITPPVLVVLQPTTNVSVWRHLTGSLVCFATLCVLYLPRPGAGEINWIPLVQIVLLAGFFASIATWTWSLKPLIVFRRIAQLFVLGSLISWAWLEFPVPNHGYLVNPNANGAVLAYLFGLSMMSVRPGGSLASVAGLCGWACVALFAVGTTVARASLLAMLAGSAVYVAWPLLCRRRQLFIAAFWLPLLIVAAMTALEAVLLEQAHAHGLGALSHDLTGKTLATRARVWEPVFAAITERPIWGHGPGVDIADVINDDLSSHSIYLQVTLQTGLIGLGVLLLLLYRIWSTFWLGRNDPTVRAAGAVLIGMLLHQGFVVSLTQNHVAIGTIVWLTLGIGVARSIAIQCNRQATPTVPPRGMRHRDARQKTQVNRATTNAAGFHLALRHYVST